MKWFAAILVMAMGATSGALWAEEPLRLDALLSEIRLRNPSAAAAEARLRAAGLRVDRARAFEDPRVQAMVEDIPPNFRNAMPMVRLQATQMLPWPGKRDRMAGVAAREAEAIGSRVDTVFLDLTRAGKRAYHDLYLNAEARRINREQRMLVDTLVILATQRLSTGHGSHHDVLKMQTETTMLDDELIMLDADRREMAAMLNALLDRAAESPVPDPEAAWTPARPIDRTKMLAAAAEGRPELREMGAMAGAERAMAEVARREFYPDIMVGALYDIRMGATDGLGAMVGVNVPIWIASRQRLDARAAEARAHGFERERAAMAAMVRAEIERAATRIEAAEKRIALFDSEFIPRAQQTFDAALRAFPAGMMPALEILDALRAVTTQRFNRVAAAVERERGLVDLERAVGVVPTRKDGVR